MCTDVVPNSLEVWTSVKLQKGIPKSESRTRIRPLRRLGVLTLHDSFLTLRLNVGHLLTHAPTPVSGTIELSVSK